MLRTGSEILMIVLTMFHNRTVSVLNEEILYSIFLQKSFNALGLTRKGAHNFLTWFLRHDMVPMVISVRAELGLPRMTTFGFLTKNQEFQNVLKVLWSEHSRVHFLDVFIYQDQF